MSLEICKFARYLEILICKNEFQAAALREGCAFKNNRLTDIICS